MISKAYNYNLCNTNLVYINIIVGTLYSHIYISLYVTCIYVLVYSVQKIQLVFACNLFIRPLDNLYYDTFNSFSVGE